MKQIEQFDPTNPPQPGCYLVRELKKFLILNKDGSFEADANLVEDENLIWHAARTIESGELPTGEMAFTNAAWKSSVAAYKLQKEAEAFAASVGSTDAALDDKEHSPNPDCSHGNGVATRLAGENAEVRPGWRLVRRQIEKSGSPDGKGNWHHSKHESVTVESPDGVQFSF